MSKNYFETTLDEYFSILERENEKRSKLVAQSLVKYMQDSKKDNKFKQLKQAQG
jgi:hypothetical protein